jgi:two-component system chemotaxis response regulator CheB
VKNENENENEGKKASAPHHDILVIGASSGGVKAMLQLVAALPRDLEAAVFVVVHLRAEFASRLPEMLARTGPLPATHAVHGEKIVAGRIYVAPPDNHLMVAPGIVQVVRGPRENGHRPAVDALFRTASAAYGSRVIGVVLTGTMDCGTAGLLSIKARGGLAVVQDPDDAEFSAMPRNALAHVQADRVAPLQALPDVLARLVAEPSVTAAGPVQDDLPDPEGAPPNARAEVVCPSCHGVLTVSELAGFQTFRCHVGHAFTASSLVAAQSDEVERALWSAMRALEEGAALSERMATSTHGDLHHRFAERHRTQLRDAQVIKHILLNGSVLVPADATAEPGSD